MWMEHSGIFVWNYLVDMALDWFNELEMFDLRVSGDLLLGFRSGVDIDSDDWFDPFFELGHLLSWKLVSASWDVDRSVVIQYKFCVLEPPTVILKPLLLISDVLWSFDWLLFKNCLQMIESLHWDFIYIKQNNKNVDFWSNFNYETLKLISLSH